MSLEQPVKNLSQYLEEVQKTRDVWEIKDHKPLWFRGEVEKYKNSWLQPGLYRPRDKDSVLRSTPELLDIESDLYDKFMESASILCDHKPAPQEAFWDWYFLMQHHGGPTRLLDWSESALVGLYIAVGQNGKYKDDTRLSRELIDKEPPEKDPRVYILEPDKFYRDIQPSPTMIDSMKNKWKEYMIKYPELKFSGSAEDEWESCYLPGDCEDRKDLFIPDEPILLRYDRITHRVAAQRSQFIIFGTNAKSLSAKFDELKNVDDWKKKSFREIRIHAHLAYNIRRELRDCGMTESVIYPDLSGLGKEMMLLFKDRI